MANWRSSMGCIKPNNIFSNNSFTSPSFTSLTKKTEKPIQKSFNKKIILQKSKNKSKIIEL